MAKKQSFGDKFKKKKVVQELINVKVVRAHKGDNGNVRFSDKFVKVKDLSELDKMDFNN